MNDNRQLEAKEIYMKFGGSLFHMEREGEYENYKKYCVTKEQENIWDNEYQNELLSKVANEDIVSDLFLQLINTLRRTGNIKHIQMFLEFVNAKLDKMDTFSKLLVSEGVLGIVKSLMKDNEPDKTRIALEAKRFVHDILSKSIVLPITVASYYSDIDYLRDIITEDKIMLRTQKLLNEINKLGD